MNQIKGLPVDFGSVVRQHDERRIELVDERGNTPVTRHRPAVRSGDRLDLPMDRRGTGRRALQGQAFNQALQLGNDPSMQSAIGA